MKQVHIILQGKGGVGKSLIAYYLTQFLNSKNKDPLMALDSDPVNRSFSHFESLNVEGINIVSNSQVDPRKFDDLIEKIINTDNHVVIDNGASGFLPLVKYMDENEVPEILKANKRDLFIHNVITGSEATIETLNGLLELHDKFNGRCKLMIWKNPYFGDVALDGVPYEDLKVYKDNKTNIEGIIDIPALDELAQNDVTNMLMNQLTFDEVDKSSMRIMEKQRIKIFQKKLYDRIAVAI